MLPAALTPHTFVREPAEIAVRFPRICFHSGMFGDLSSRMGPQSAVAAAHGHVRGEHGQTGN